MEKCIVYLFLRDRKLDQVAVLWAIAILDRFCIFCDIVEAIMSLKVTNGYRVPCRPRSG